MLKPKNLVWVMVAVTLGGLVNVAMFLAFFFMFDKSLPLALIAINCVDFALSFVFYPAFKKGLKL